LDYGRRFIQSCAIGEFYAGLLHAEAVCAAVAGRTARSSGCSLRSQSGVYDVRLFRDGQLVGQWPEDAPGGAAKTSAVLSEAEREQWRQQHRVDFGCQRPSRNPISQHSAAATEGRRSRHVHRVCIQFRSSQKRNQPATGLQIFSARPRRAYLITMGVNATQASGPWDLSVAVPTAREAARLWQERLSQEYEVVEVSLMSEVDADGESHGPTRRRPICARFWMCWPAAKSR
jgi:hypothetical protein